MKPCTHHKTGVALMSMRVPSAVDGLTGAETPFDTPDRETDTYYAIASKRFGEGQVQLDACQKGETSSALTIDSFDCIDQTYAARFESDHTPEIFLLDPHYAEKQPLKKETVVAPLAQHACEQHGHPLLELRW
ncbi:MAG: hypothetical protein ABJQ70_02100 [Roseobacter sp.]